MDLIESLSKGELVRDLPKIKYSKDKICEACQKGKQVKSSFKLKNQVSTSRPLELLHMDLVGPSQVASLSGKHYTYVIVDDYSRFTWVAFLTHKSDAFETFKCFAKRVQNEKGYFITTLRSDHGKEFENEAFKNFCSKRGISHNFSCPRTPQQNGVVERKNRTLIEMARTMLNEYDLPTYFWVEAINTSCYILNRVSKRPILNKTPYELWNGKTPNISYFRVFGCKCYILNTKDYLGKFASKTDVGIFLGYSNSSKAYRVFNKRTLVVEESMHVTFDETSKLDLVKGSSCVDFVGEFEKLNIGEEEPQSLKELNNEKKSQEEHAHGDEIEDQEHVDHQQLHENLPKEWRFTKDHPKYNIIGETTKGVSTRNQLKILDSNLAFLSQIEPKNIDEAINDESWVLAMQEELNQFERNKV